MDFLEVGLAHFYLGKVLEREGKTADAMKSYQAFLSQFQHSKAALPQINVARSAVQRLDKLPLKNSALDPEKPRS
jgi:hypothetical protein